MAAGDKAAQFVTVVITCRIDLEHKAEGGIGMQFGVPLVHSQGHFIGCEMADDNASYMMGLAAYHLLKNVVPPNLVNPDDKEAPADSPKVSLN